MTTDEIVSYLEAELGAYPKRASAVELYEFLVGKARLLRDANRQGLVEALGRWLELRSEPRTMLAVDIASKLELTELRGALEGLLHDVKSGNAFLPYYARNIETALAAL